MTGDDVVTVPSSIEHRLLVEVLNLGIERIEADVRAPGEIPPGGFRPGSTGGLQLCEIIGTADARTTVPLAWEAKAA